MNTYAYGFPRLGKSRQYKKYTELFWKGAISEKELTSQLELVEKERINFYREKVDIFPLGEFTHYDNILDTALIFGVYPSSNLTEYYNYARGKNALKLKKYFSTNYHYLVPHITKKTKFAFAWNKPLFYYNTFSSPKNNPAFFIGPYTFLKLSSLDIPFPEALEKLTSVYCTAFRTLAASGVPAFHIEEPAFVEDISSFDIRLIRESYKEILKTQTKINIITYYESCLFVDKLYDLPFAAIGLDFIAGRDNLALLKKKKFPHDKKLICGVVDGKNPRRTNIASAARLIDDIRKTASLSKDQLLISNSCPLQHLPVTLENETHLKPGVRKTISFAKERLQELALIKEVLSGDTSNAHAWSNGVKEKEIKSGEVLFNTLSFTNKDFKTRKKLHTRLYGLPLFPITAIGSFPQDSELRSMRLAFRRKKVTSGKYKKFIRGKIKELIRFQEKMHFDVLVHGEFERTDMVEFFAQKLKGFITTENGWVTSYGTRAYRPPIISDTIKREKPLTVEETLFAQSLTAKPVKGILTGPATIIAWSYNLRQDTPATVAFELASALNEEARELARNNIHFIQIDEPAIKEFAPIRRHKRDAYFSWAIRAFNIAARLAKKNQIHTHMCYSEFGDILGWILKMNFDVITIEAAREEAKIIGSFAKTRFCRDIGPGVWDIHSRYPAETKRIAAVLDKAIKVFGKENVWLNPDCGLKTREWPEVTTSFERILEAAREYRKKYQKEKCQ